MKSDVKPQIISEAEAQDLKSKPEIKLVDIYQQQLQELEKIHYAQKDNQEAWVFYPHNQTLLHTVNEPALFALRTNRNQLLITSEEQQKLAQSVVGIAGMSVGAGMAKALAYSGISKHIKIADFDTLDTTNLNRLEESLLSVGQPKAALAAQHIYELDPFLNVEMFEEGLTAENITKFYSDPPLNLVIDEIDDFKLKVIMRVEAKKHGVPLMMFTSLGDNILIDIERYDTDPNAEIFHGLLPDLSKEILDKVEINEDDARRYAVQLVGAEYVPTRAMESLLEMGKTLSGRPQLYSTIAADGGIAAYISRQILLGAPVKSGRYYISFAGLAGMTSEDLADTPERRAIIQKLTGPPKK